MLYRTGIISGNSITQRLMLCRCDISSGGEREPRCIPSIRHHSNIKKRKNRSRWRPEARWPWWMAARFLHLLLAPTRKQQPPPHQSSWDCFRKYKQLQLNCRKSCWPTSTQGNASFDTCRLPTKVSQFSRFYNKNRAVSSWFLGQNWEKVSKDVMQNDYHNCIHICIFISKFSTDSIPRP